MFGFLKKSKLKIFSPARGILKSITEVEDEAFRSKALGDGFAIEPRDGEVYSPIDGVVEMIFPTLHALGIKSNDNAEILIHIGTETVELNGQGFEAFVKEGQKVKAGDLLIKFDIDEVKEKVPSTDVMVVFTNGETCELLKAGEMVNTTDEIATIK
ncbi:PTS glucose transporter subunit IIA [Clostridium intestinale]|uniref:PTS sugar transporter subunit IIA n=1 Tax=Clostridium intestinale TaxID=36845 RepID=UPI0028ECA05D|nr:PTS glucose transporter subunit IIA [Clostridium intestinale]